jgi:nitroimidazol reductase NimA-like FMN-containing flavoprotein (pyridoxamine 5'-phosphate oxidase superfamily)
MTEFETTPRNKVRRLPARASYDAQAIYPIIDAAMVCHVAFVTDGQPFVIPTQHARVGDTLLFHGSPGSRLIRVIESGQPLSVSFAMVDGLVVARSIFHHSVNYRSAVVFGRGRKIEAEDEVLAALRAFSEKVLPGRWDEARPPSLAELRVTAVAAIDIESASAKLRSGPPGDALEDMQLPVWAGVVPLRQAAGPLESDSAETVPASVKAYLRAVNGE